MFKNQVNKVVVLTERGRDRERDKEREKGRKRDGDRARARTENDRRRNTENAAKNGKSFQLNFLGHFA